MKCKVFKISLHNEDLEESKLNDLLANVEVRQIFASVVNDIENFWSVMIFYDEPDASVKPARGVNAAPALSGKSYSIPAAAAIPVKPAAPEAAPLTRGQEKSFEALKAWRNERARLEGLPAYVVAHDELLMQIAAAHIRTREDLLRIKDFGHKRTEIYGEEIVKILFANA